VQLGMARRRGHGQAEQLATSEKRRTCEVQL